MALKVVMCSYEPEKQDLFSFTIGEDGRIESKVLDPGAQAFCNSVLRAPMHIAGKWIKANDSPLSWLNALPIAYAGSRVQAHIER